MSKTYTFIQLAVALLAGTTGLVVTGCQPEGLQPQTGRLQQKQLTIQGTYELPESDTKTVLHSDGHVYWVPGDAISLFYGSGTEGGSKFTAIATEDSRVTNFTGSIGVVTGGDEIGEEDTYFWGLYPYDPQSVCDGQTITVKIEESQVGAPNTFASGYAPSLGHERGLMLAFRSLYSGFWFTVTQPGFRSVTLRSNNGELISGRAKYGFGSDGLPEVRQILEGKPYVTVSAPNAEGFEVGKKYYVLTFPQTLSGGFSMELSSTTQTGKFTVTRSVQLKRNQISNVKDLDTKSSFSPIEVLPSMISDANFRTYLFDRFDSNRDGVLSANELEAVTTISLNVVNYDIASMQGIEYLPNLIELACWGTRTNKQGQYVMNGKLTSLDVSSNKKLQRLRLYYNNVTSLDVSQNAELNYLDTGGNPISSLDLTHNPELQTLNCYGMGLTSLDVTQNPKLIYLYCDQNQLTELDVTHNPDLLILECYENQLTVLDVTCNPDLQTLSCQSNQLSTLDVSHNPGLLTLYYGYNPLTEPVDFSNNKALTNLYCAGLALTSLDVSFLPDLYYLGCGSNQLTSLDLSQNPALTELNCQGNKLSSLILTNNPLLRYVYCDSNPLTALDLSANSSLQTVYCYDCKIQNLNVSNCTLLRNLYCYNNQLTTLDIRSNPMLKYLNCWNNPMTTLYMVAGQTFQTFVIPDGVEIITSVAEGVAIDEEHFPDEVFRSYVAANYDNGDGILTDTERELVTSISIQTDNIVSVKGIELFPNLNYLSVRGSGRQNGIVKGKLASLDISGNPKLVTLYCYYNQLTALDLSNNPELDYVSCYYNQLTELKVSKNAKLRSLYCYNNALAALDLSGCPLLEILSCSNNQMVSLNLSGCTSLNSLSCGSNQLTELDLSGNTKLTYVYAPYNYNTLKSVTLPESLTSLPSYAFANNYALTDMDIPASVTSIGNNAFYYCTSMRAITLHSVTPPAGSSNMFTRTHDELIIIVPKSAVATYKAAEYWKDYADRITYAGSGDNEDIGYIYW